MNSQNTLPLIEGIVCRRNLSVYLVALEARMLTCTFSARSEGARRSEGAQPAPVAGDRVSIRLDSGGTGSIVRILPRRNTLSRRAAGSSRGISSEQVLAANLDRLIALCAVDYAAPEWNLLDRMLAAAEAAGLPACIVFSKADRLPADPSVRASIRREADEFRRIGYPVAECSAITGEGIEAIRPIFCGRTTALLGKSGAGKSSLLNALYPGWALRTNAPNRFGEGRCTTSNAELLPLEDGGAVIDTPGVCTLVPWMEESVNPVRLFREMQALEGKCRFGSDCRHREEPGCAVRRAVESGAVTPRRFRSMLRLAEDIP